MSLGQAMSGLANGIADAIKPGTQSNSSAPQTDLQKAVLEVVKPGLETLSELSMPKIDRVKVMAELAGEMVNQYTKNVEQDLAEQKKKEQQEQEDLQRKINLGLIKPEETLMSKKEEQEKDPVKKAAYSVSEYMELADALRQAGRPVSNDNLIDANLEKERRRIGDA